MLVAQRLTASVTCWSLFSSTVVCHRHMKSR